MKMRNLFVLSFVVILAACSGSDNTTEETTTSETAETESRPISKSATVGGSPDAVLEKNGYKLTPMTPSPSYPDAGIKTMEYNKGNWSFGIGGTSYSLGVQTDDAETKGCANSAKGQHIHLIVGQEPYVAKYESEFEHEIPDGKHPVLAFLSRSYHESIKQPAAYRADLLYVQDNSVVRQESIESPAVFYSRPKGVYEGEDTKRVMLDYYLVNASENHYVKADINGVEFTLPTWQPYLIEGLQAGDNTITLTLMDENGPVTNELSPVSRTFKLNP